MKESPFHLYTTSNRFVIEREGNETCLELTRTGTDKGSFVFQQILKGSRVLILRIEIVCLEKISFFADEIVQPIYGVVGAICLLKGHYLIVITSRLQVATINNWKLYKATNFKVIPFNPNVKLTEAQVSSIVFLDLN